MTPSNTRFCAASVVTHSEWPEALQFLESFQTQYPETSVHLLALEAPPKDLHLPKNARLTLASELDLADFYTSAMQYQPAEFVARLKPHFLLRLLQQFEKVLYFAPSVQVFGSLEPLLSKLDSASVLLVPRYLSPHPEICPETEIEALRTGQYHPGFLAIRHTPHATAFLVWLEARCRELAFDEPAQGLCLDQKWLNLAPCLFPEILIERSPGLLVGSWNLHERILSKKENRWWVNAHTPLLLLHTQGLADSPLLPSKLPTPAFQNSLPYRFDHFSDGSPISAVARRIFAISHFRDDTRNPFEPHSAFEQFCRQRKLIGPAEPLLRPSPLPHDNVLARLIRLGFRSVLRIFGATRYEMLMKYLRYLSSARNQHELFFRGKNPERTGLDPNVYGRIRE